MTNYKIKDMEAVVAYMKGKDCVAVKDIIAESGADGIRVYPIIAELHTAGKLDILECEELGSPKTVKLL